MSTRETRALLAPVSGHTHYVRPRIATNSGVTARDPRARTVEDFLAGARDAVVARRRRRGLRSGRRPSIPSPASTTSVCCICGRRSGTWSGACLMPKCKHEVLRLAVQRLGQTRPSKLEICRQRDRRTPTAKRAARMAYQRALQAHLERRFPAYIASRLTQFVGRSGAVVWSHLCPWTAARRDSPPSRCWE